LSVLEVLALLAQAGHVVRVHAKHKHVLPPCRTLSSDLDALAPSMVPMIRQPFIWNFMLEVPLASVPAVLMC